MKNRKLFAGPVSGMNISQFIISEEVVSKNTQKHFNSIFGDFFLYERPEKENVRAFLEKNAWKGDDWFRYIEKMQGAKEAYELMDSYYCYHKEQERAFHALVELDQEAMNAGEPSFLLTTVEKHDWGKMDFILSEVVSERVDHILTVVFGEQYTGVNFDRVWKKVKAGLDQAKVNEQIG